MPGGWRLWLRWSVRDLRQRWVLVCATALLIALGTGVYAGLTSMTVWRTESYDASYRALASHDLRVTLSQGAFVAPGRLKAALRRLDPALLAGAEERLVAPVQVEASVRGTPILVPGRVVGVDVAAAGEPTVDRIAVARGRSLRRTDAGRAVAVLDQHFAAAHDLPATGVLRVGASRVRYVGQGETPEYFLVTTGVGWGAQASFAVLLAPLDSAGRLVGHPGAVDELVVRLAPGTDPAAVEQALRAALRAELPRTGVTITRLADEDVHRTLYRDADNDARTFAIYAWVLLGSAAFSAFVLISRVVEGQRRQIGIGMALGLPPRLLAARPLLMAAEIALLGVGFGIGVGVAFGELLSGLMEDFTPLPVYGQLFRLDRFATAAALGFALPFAAAAWPVWRGVAATPVDTIQVGVRTAARAGLAPLLGRLALPGSALAQMPLRNLLRAPGRTALTALGVAAVLVAMVSMGGLVDSMRSTLDRSEAKTLASAPQRVDATLAGFLPASGAEVRAVRALPAVGRVEPDLQVQGTVSHAGRSVDVALRLLPARGALWRPRLTSGALAPDADGIVLSERAASQLGVRVGDRVTLRHPRRSGPATLDVVADSVRVAGLHDNPFRFLAYADASRAGPLLGLAGATNLLTVAPAPGHGAADLQRALFGRSGVAAAEPASTLTDTAQEAVDGFLSAIVLTEAIVLVIALLIAFNTASVSSEERRREHATMFAFGVPPRSVLRMAMLENLVVGLLATALGLALGLAMLGWMVSVTVPDSFPELGITISLSPVTVVTVVLVGTVAVALAPLLTARRLRRMDVPSTLRVVE